VTIHPNSVMWSAPESERAGRPLLVLLHGYGSHEGDLFGLGPGLPLGPVIASVRAPIELAPGMYSWFPLMSEAPAEEVGPNADAAARSVLDWLDTVSSGPVHLLGFSQGGAMALQLLRVAPGRFASATVLAGFLAGVAHEGDAALAAAPPPVFYGRGTHDDRIDSARVDQLDAWLPGHADATSRIYEGLGHSISNDELRDLNAFLATVL